ncbi:MAG: rod shape-determining protein RodA [Planctomycetes bacterium]|nr:rod shape-determining protein RodA [Planctomycetota bacterium]
MRRAGWFSWPSGFGGTRLPSVTMLTFLITLLALGTVFVHSASSAGEEPFPGALTRLHLYRMGFGVGFLVLFLLVHYRILEELWSPLYVAGLALLGYLLVNKWFFGGGVQRWIRLGFINIQPSELIKLFTVLALAKVLKPMGRDPTRANRLIPLVLVGVPFTMVAVQPDLGTALVLIPVLFAMLWTAGASKRRLLGYASALVLCAPLGWFVLADYQVGRVLVFLDPYAPELREESYQIRHSMTAIGSGGWTGTGLFQGSQNTLEFLPEDHNDFIFAVIGEEWGLAGTLGLLVLFLCLFFSCLGIAYRTREPFGRLVVVGITTQLAAQTLINLAMTTGIAPVTGLPLPFISFGGSALFVSLASMGIVLGIGMRPVRVMNPDGLTAGTSVR